MGVAHAPLVHLQRLVPPLRVVQAHRVVERDLAPELRAGVDLLFQHDRLEQLARLDEPALAHQRLALPEGAVPANARPVVDGDPRVLAVLVQFLAHARAPRLLLLLRLRDELASLDGLAAAVRLRDVIRPRKHAPRAHLGLVRLLVHLLVAARRAGSLSVDVRRRRRLVQHLLRQISRFLVAESRARRFLHSVPLVVERHARHHLLDVVVDADAALAPAAGVEHVGKHALLAAGPAGGALGRVHAVILLEPHNLLVLVERVVVRVAGHDLHPHLRRTARCLAGRRFRLARLDATHRFGHDALELRLAPHLRAVLLRSLLVRRGFRQKRRARVSGVRGGGGGGRVVVPGARADVPASPPAGRATKGGAVSRASWRGCASDGRSARGGGDARGGRPDRGARRHDVRERHGSNQHARCDAVRAPSSEARRSRGGRLALRGASGLATTFYRSWRFAGFPNARD